MSDQSSSAVVVAVADLCLDLQFNQLWKEASSKWFLIGQMDMINDSNSVDLEGIEKLANLIDF